MQEGAVDQAAIDQPVLEEIWDGRRRETGCRKGEEGSLCMIHRITREEDRGTMLLANAKLAAANEMSIP